jgi:hypothetical protein
MLAAVMWAAFGGVAWLAYERSGAIGVQAAAVGAAVCWFSGTLALVSAGLFRDPRQMMFQLLFGMIFRMGLPLGIGLVLQTRGGVLSRAGVFGYIVGFYLLTLVVETFLAMTLAKPAGTRSGIS